MPARETPPDRELKLDFPPVDYAAWRRRVEEELGGKSFERELVARTHEGVDVEPLYAAGSPPAIERATFPGRPAGERWLIAEEYRIPSVAGAAAAIAAGRDRGVELVWLPMDFALEGVDDCPPEDPASPIKIWTIDGVERLMARIDLDSTPVVIEAADRLIPWAAAWVAAARRQSYEPDELRGGFGCDPLGDLAECGYNGESLERTFGQMLDLTAWTRSHAPGLRSVLVSTSPYHDAGASAAEELALGLATGVEYLRRLTGAGLGVDAAVSQMFFATSVSSDLFVEIAKLRAARLLWSKAVRAAGGSEGARPMWLHSRGSARSTARRDPRMNLLRGGAQGLAAALGGADSIAVAPFDEPLWQAADRSRRLAAAAQHILAEEAHLGRVADPAAGSWCVEALSDRLARAAWALFQDLERRGGMARCLLEGRVHEIVHRSCEARYRAATALRDPLVGVSFFVELDEKPPGRRPGERGAKPLSPKPPRSGRSMSAGELRVAMARVERELEALQRTIAKAGRRSLPAGELTRAAIEAADAGAPIERLWSLFKDDGSRDQDLNLEMLGRCRLAAPFEELRDLADRCFQARGSRPRAFLALLADAGRARAVFARRLLASGGVEGVEGGPFEDPEDVFAAFAESGAHLAVVCAGDDLDPDLVPELASGLVERGARRTLLARRGGEHEALLRQAGVDDFLYQGCDLVKVLGPILVDLAKEASS